MINVNIRDRQCAMPECAKYPSCNFPGSTDGLYCGAWSKVSLIQKKVAVPTVPQHKSALFF